MSTLLCNSGIYLTDDPNAVGVNGGTEGAPSLAA